MAHLTNPLATADQLYRSLTAESLPADLQDSIRYATARLSQAAGILLKLPQSVIAQSIVILQRYWLIADPMKFEFSDASAASMYLAAKVSMSPRSMRSIANVYTYLLSSSSTLSPAFKADQKLDPDDYYLTEGSYIDFQQRILNIEGQILYSLAFNTHVALPHSWAITYLQALDVIGPKTKKAGAQTAKRAIAYLNTALLSPQLVYLTQQPSSLAVAAIYLAAKDVGVKLPDVEWWEVFDTDREDLGSMVLIIKSLEGWALKEQETWGKTILTRADVQSALRKRGNISLEDEEQLMRLVDDRQG